MRRFIVVGLILLALLAALPVGAAAAQTTPDATTTTAPPPAEGGTSPWVLVAIGMAAGAAVGVFTGLARRRRAERELGRR